jgi:hypothetical protein
VQDIEKIIQCGRSSTVGLCLLWVDSRLLPAKFRLVAIYELMRNERQRSNLNLA